LATSHQVKVCPSCEVEYTLRATECSECRVELVFHEDLAVEEPEDLPPASQLVCIRAAPIDWIRILSDKLSLAGVPHRIEAIVQQDKEGAAHRRTPGASAFGVFVRPEDEEQAGAIDQEHMAAEVGLDDVDEPAGDADPTACPACQAPLGDDASECQSCGLQFPDAS
jgi:ribosomal protein L40E